MGLKSPVQWHSSFQCNRSFDHICIFYRLYAQPCHLELLRRWQLQFLKFRLFVDVSLLKVIYCELVVRQYDVSMFNFKGVKQELPKKYTRFISSSKLCAVLWGCISLIPIIWWIWNNLFTSLLKNLWPFQLDTVEGIQRCLWRPQPFPSPRNHSLQSFPPLVYQSWQRKVSSTGNLRTSKVFLAVACLGEPWQYNRN